MENEQLYDYEILNNAGKFVAVNNHAKLPFNPDLPQKPVVENNLLANPDLSKNLSPKERGKKI